MFRVSLREMFVLVAVAAVALVSLITASSQWQMISYLLVMLSAMIAIIVGLVDRGSRRAFAIGFSVAMLGYLLTVLNAQKFVPDPGGQFGAATQNFELDVYGGRLPTSVILSYFYAGVSRTVHFDAKTGAQISKSESGNLFVVGEGPGGIGGFGSPQISTPPGKRAAYINVSPPRQYFMVLGHSWWALLFGYVGGHFARVVYLRREREAARNAPSPNTVLPI